jgi:hypothetical protein
MPNNKQLNNIHCAARILDARAGLIPASDDIEDELNARTARIGRTVRAYAKLTHGRDDLAITDILHDLRHYCDQKALAFDQLDTPAYEHYLEDAAESPWISRAPVS